MAHIDNIPITHESRVMKDLQTWVREAGAEWCGIQTSMFPALPQLVIKNPKTQHIIIMSFQPGTSSVEVVMELRAKLEEDNATVPIQTVTVKVETLKKLRQTLSDFVSEIDALLR